MTTSVDLRVQLAYTTLQAINEGTQACCSSRGSQAILRLMTPVNATVGRLAPLSWLNGMDYTAERIRAGDVVQFTITMDNREDEGSSCSPS